MNKKKEATNRGIVGKKSELILSSPNLEPKVIRTRMKTFKVCEVSYLMPLAYHKHLGGGGGGGGGAYYISNGIKAWILKCKKYDLSVSGAVSLMNKLKHYS